MAVSDHHVHAPWTNGPRCSAPRRPSIEVLRSDRSHNRIVGGVSDFAADRSFRRLAILAGAFEESRHRLPSSDIESFRPVDPRPARRGVSPRPRRTGGDRSCVGRGGTRQQAPSDAGRVANALASGRRPRESGRKSAGHGRLFRAAGSNRPRLRGGLRRTGNPVAPHHGRHAASAPHGSARRCGCLGCDWTNFNSTPQRNVVGEPPARSPGGSRSAGGAGSRSHRLGIRGSGRRFGDGRFAAGLGRPPTNPDRQDGGRNGRRRDRQAGRRHATGGRCKVGG